MYVELKFLFAVHDEQKYETSSSLVPSISFLGLLTTYSIGHSNCLQNTQ